MADFEKFISNPENQILKDYLNEFPKKLLQLVSQVISFHSVLTIFSKSCFLQGKIAKFSSNSVLINYNLLSKYLMSDDSLFEVQSLHDFLETLSILGFHRSLLPVKKKHKHLCYRFLHPHFQRSNPIPEDLFKHWQVDQSNTVFKNTKRMLDKFGSHFLQRLLNNRSRKEQEIAMTELPQKKLMFALQKQLDSMGEKTLIVEYTIEVPDYIMKNEIAGYYGNVSLGILQKGFQSFFPIYKEVSAIAADLEVVKKVDNQVAIEDPVLVYFNDEEIMDMMAEIKPEATPKRAMKRNHTENQICINKETEALFLYQDVMETEE